MLLLQSLHRTNYVNWHAFNMYMLVCNQVQIIITVMVVCSTFFLLSAMERIQNVVSMHLLVFFKVLLLELSTTNWREILSNTNVLQLLHKQKMANTNTTTTAVVPTDLIFGNADLPYAKVSLFDNSEHSNLAERISNNTNANKNNHNTNKNGLVPKRQHWVLLQQWNMIGIPIIC